MKTIEFELKNNTTLVPVKGKTMVKVRTNGKVMIVDSDRNERPSQPKYYTLIRTERAKLMLSRRGCFRKIEVRLPVNSSSRNDFLREVNTLFDEELIEKYL